MNLEKSSNSGRTRDPRRAILDLLKRRGPLGAAFLAKHFGVTAMAVRQHLYALQDGGLVKSSASPSGRGRPAKQWALTEKAYRLFPDAHQELAVDLMGHMRAQFGDSGLGAIIDRHSAAQTRAYGKAMSGLTTIEARVRKLAQLRSEEGYMAQVLQDDQGWLLVENHCPICAAARQCTRLCANELGVFEAVLGPDAQVRRVEHVLEGARRCAYRVEVAKTASSK